MEQYTVIDQATGQIKRSGSTPFAQAHPIEVGEAMYVGAQLSAREYYFVAGEPVAYTEEERQALAARPGYTSQWDVASKAWIDMRTTEELQTRHRAAIEVERDARILAPVIVYDGKNLDADAASLDRLTKKLATTRIQSERGISPPAETLVWRDADNVTHVFADLATYRTWLDGFALALDTRGMLAFGWSWAKKAALEALGDDLEALRAFDPTA